MSQAPIITIFGISGDLAGRKLLPALYHLLSHGTLSPLVKIVGVSRRALDQKTLLNDTELCILEQDKICNPKGVALLNDALELITLDLEDRAGYDALRQHLDEIDPTNQRERIFYLSIPPQAYGTVTKLLGESGLNTANCRLLIEKPFGSDTESALRLIDSIGEQFDESQIYRIDHYLAKETAQNLLAFRLHNPIFSSLWDHQSIESIRVRALETIGVENRASFYESTGALRDLIQGHLLQILSLVMMERPQSEDADAVHATKTQLLESLSLTSVDQSVRGQYEGYKQEVKNETSFVETYARITLQSSIERWQGVPIILETGKALAEKTNDVTIQFKQEHEHQRNRLIFLLQPAEGISLDLLVKKPGFDNELQHAALDLSYDKEFGTQTNPEAYERVLMDAVRGDQSLFASSGEVLASWRVVQPLIDAWTQDAKGLQVYQRGSEGPEE